MQTNVKVDDNGIDGTLKYLSSGTLVDNFGPGNFLALKFDVPEDATSCKVGLFPSEGTGLVEIIDDPDRNGAFKITDKTRQRFKIVTTDSNTTVTKILSLRGLTTLSE